MTGAAHERGGSIVVAASLTIDPSQRDELAHMLAQVGAASRAEPGCREYRLSVDLDASNQFLVLEEWSSGAELEAHLETAHVAQFFSALSRLRVLHASIDRYVVSAKRKVM